MQPIRAPAAQGPAAQAAALERRPAGQPNLRVRRLQRLGIALQAQQLLLRAAEGRAPAETAAQLALLLAQRVRHALRARACSGAPGRRRHALCPTTGDMAWSRPRACTRAMHAVASACLADPA